MILSKKRITKALIRLHVWAGWSAPLLFANTKDKFSHAEAKIIKKYMAILDAQSVFKSRRYLLQINSQSFIKGFFIAMPEKNKNIYQLPLILSAVLHIA